MAFVKYNTKDNAYSTLLVGISAGALSLQVQASAGAGFPSSNFIATIVQYTTLGDETSAVVKREKVLVSNNATDTFTITRGFDGDTPVAFNAGDFIYLHNVSAITEDIQDEVTRLETAKLNIGALRTGLATAWRFFFSNGSNAETGLAFGSSGTVLTSNGATSSPTFETPTVSIVGLTADTTGNMDADYLVKNNGTGANTKILVNKYKASDAEAIAGTVTNKFLSPSQLKYKTGMNLSVSNQTVSQGGTTQAYSVGAQSTKGGIVTIIRNYDGNPSINPNTWGLQFSTNGSSWTTMWTKAYTGTVSQNAQESSPSFILNAGQYYRVFAGGTGSNTAVLTVTAYLQEAS